MTNREILAAALRQSAVDANCSPEDFLRQENVFVTSVRNENARKYLDLPLPCGLISYGTNVVASTEPRYRALAEAYVDRHAPYRCFETPQLLELDRAFRPHGLRVCFMAEYWLPDVEALPAISCPLETRLLGPEDFAPLYRPAWSNALCEKRRELDVLGVGAYDGGELAGLAACSADCGGMWQIGVDVLPEYRRRGVASALTSRLALEILRRGKVPFYCCAWSNVASARNAVRSGFRPAWVELTVKPSAVVEQMSGGPAI